MMSVEEVFAFVLLFSYPLGWIFVPLRAKKVGRSWFLWLLASILFAPLTIIYALFYFRSPNWVGELQNSEPFKPQKSAKSESGHLTGDLVYHLATMICYWGDGKLSESELQKLKLLFNRYYKTGIARFNFADPRDEDLSHKEYLISVLEVIKQTKAELLQKDDSKSGKEYEKEIVRDFSRELDLLLRAAFSGDKKGLASEANYINGALTDLAKLDGYLKNEKLLINIIEKSTKKSIKGSF
tara:strand:- start:213 stop:932 length:720 start_codon:yes stop_codon:yes gene_type:complete